MNIQANATYQSKLAYLQQHAMLLDAEQTAYEAWRELGQQYPESDPAVRELWQKWNAASKAVEQHTQEREE